MPQLNESGKFSITNKKSIGTIVVLTILLASGGVLYFGDIQRIWETCLNDNSNLEYCVYSVERGSQGITQIEMLTHNTLTDTNADFVRWKFNNNGLTVYNGRNIVAEAKWYVDYYQTYGTDKWITLNKKASKTVLEIQDFNTYVILRKTTEYYATSSNSGNGGSLVEELMVGQKWHKYSTKWIPSNARINTQHRLSWKVTSFGLGQETPRVLKDEYSLQLASQVSVSWLDAIESVDTATLTNKALSVVFKPKKGEYLIDPSIGIGFSDNDWALFSKGWYTDIGNDSCISVYSDKQLYRLNENYEIDVLFKIDNKCGNDFLANISLLGDNKNYSKLNVLNIAQSTTNEEKATKSSYFCNGILSISGVKEPSQYNLYHATCTSDLNANTVFDKDIYSYNSKDKIVEFYSVYKIPIFVDKTFSSSNNTLGYANFEKVNSMGSVNIPKGESYLNFTIKVPLDTGEFVLTLVNPLDVSQKSILDPDYTGAGSALDPYIITTCVGLQDMNYHLNDSTVYFKLGSDINCSNTKNWVKAGGGLKGFEPIGNTDAPFRGNFDGANYVIRNLMVYQDVNAYAGLFGRLYGGAKIKNVGLIDFNIYNSSTSSGALAGSGHSAGPEFLVDINNVWVWGGSIIGTDYVGGLIGINYGDINQVFVKDTYIRSTTGGTLVGGITGMQNVLYHGSIWHAYSTARISTLDTNVGGIGGSGSNTPCIGCYWNKTDSNIAIGNVYGTVITQANQKKAASYVNWNFTNIWGIVEDVNTPYLLANPLTEGEISDPLPPSVVIFKPINLEWKKGTVNIDVNVWDANKIMYAFMDSNISKTCFSDTNVSNTDFNIYAITDINFTWNTMNVGCATAFDVNIIATADDWNMANGRTVKSVIARIDNVVPVTVSNDLNSVWQRSDVNVQIKCYDVHSKCKTLYYSLDDINYYKNWGTDLNIGINLTTDGNHEIFYLSSDNADNNGVTKLAYVEVDKSAPIINIIKPTDLNMFYNSNLVSFDLNDAYSGINIASVKVDINSVKSTYFNWETDCTKFDVNWYCEYNELAFDTNSRDYNVTIFVDDNALNVGRHTHQFKYIITPSVLWGNVNNYYLNDNAGIDLYPDNLVDQNVTPFGQNDTNGIFRVTNNTPGGAYSVDVYLDLNQALPNDSNLVVCKQNRRVQTYVSDNNCMDVNASSPAKIITSLSYNNSQMLWWFFDVNVIGIQGWEFIVDYRYTTVFS